MSTSAARAEPMLLVRSCSIALLACCLGAGCAERPTIDEARQEVANAAELIKGASALNGEGKAELAEAQAMQAQDKLTRARDLYLSARADQGDDVGVLTEFAALCERLRDFDLAGEAYLRAAQLGQAPAAGEGAADLAVLWYGAARNFVFAGGRYLARAADPLDQAERLVRGGAAGVSMADIAATRGDISWKNGAYPLAAKHYAEALTADPNHLRAQMLHVCGAIATGDLAPAGAALNELQSRGAPVGEGTSFDARLREAYAAYRRSRPAIPDDAPTYRALAGISVRVGFLDDARAAIEHALTLDDRDVYSWNMAGSLAHQAGDIEQAREAFTRSLALDPNQPRTQEALKQLPVDGDADPGPLRSP